MTLIEIINKLKTYAEGQYNNPKVLVGSLYENLNTKEKLTYPCINIDNANAMKRENEIVYNFYIYYADRLSESGDNMLQIQSEATTALQMMLHKILDAGSINLDDYYNVVITPFKLKFTDVCAGAWMQVNVHAVGLDACDDGSQISTLYITANGNYNVEDYDLVNVNVSGGSGSNIVEISKEEYDALVSAGTIDENTLYIISGYTDNYELGYASGWTDGYNTSSEGLYQSGYTSGYTDGYQSGETDGFQSGYISGHTDGYNEGFDSGFTSGYTSGNTDGFQSGYTSGETVGFQSGYTSGHTDGYNEGTADGFGSGYTSGYTDGYEVGYEEGEESVPLTSTSITENGIFAPAEGGWNEVEVNVSTGITPSGEIEITENGIYDVYNKATANVEIPVWDYYQSGYTSGSTDGFQNGYASGYTDGFQSGYTSGNTDGFQSGYTSGHTDGYQDGYTSGHTDGVQSGFTSGYTSGHTDGYNEGESAGFQDGYTSGHTDGVQSGFTSGYTSGHTDGVASGYSSGYTVGYIDGYQVGYEEGEESVPLSSTGFTQNGTYTAVEGGWDEVEVNVPSVTTQTLTQAQYDALQVKDPMVIYLING